MCVCVCVCGSARARITRLREKKTSCRITTRENIEVTGVKKQRDRELITGNGNIGCRVDCCVYCTLAVVGVSPAVPAKPVVGTEPRALPQSIGRVFRAQALDVSFFCACLPD